MKHRVLAVLGCSYPKEKLRSRKTPRRPRAPPRVKIDKAASLQGVLRGLQLKTTAAAGGFGEAVVRSREKPVEPVGSPSAAVVSFLHPTPLSCLDVPTVLLSPRPAL